MEVKLKADKVKVYGPKIDGSYTVTLEVGEYEREAVASLFTLSTSEVVNVTIEQND